MLLGCQLKNIINKLIKPLGIKIDRIKEQRSTMNASLRWLSQNGFKIRTVLDVGASDGRWSADCMMFFQDADYVLFEPQPIHAEKLESFASSCKKSVVIINKAVGGSEGHTFFNINNPFGGALSNKDDGCSIKVPVTTIDSAMAEINYSGPYLLKLDTHGFEKLRGCCPNKQKITFRLDLSRIYCVLSHSYCIIASTWRLSS